jgi:DNA-binding NarL/FixJ family response regulator
MPKKKIIIVDDDLLVPMLIKEMVDEEEDLEIAEMAATKDGFLSLISKMSFDAALIDLSMRDNEGGLGMLQAIKDRHIKLPVIILSAHDENTYAAKCLEMGAVGYVNKMHICNDLVNALKTVLSGGLFVSGTNGESILKQYTK